jgi:hypothetical protein
MLLVFGLVATAFTSNRGSGQHTRAQALQAVATYCAVQNEFFNCDPLRLAPLYERYILTGR